LQAKAFGRKLLGALTEAFGKTILGTGFFHADPHPGNVFVLDDGRIGLIDFGQVKQVRIAAIYIYIYIYMYIYVYIYREREGYNP